MVGYKLPAKYVVHTVGPIGEDPEVLGQCYWRCLELAVTAIAGGDGEEDDTIRSIAFPCISTGVYGYPSERAAKVAVETIRRWLATADNARRLDEIIFCTFLDKDAAIYERLLYSTNKAE